MSDQWQELRATLGPHKTGRRNGNTLRALLAERDALAERAERLHKALRAVSIETTYAHGFMHAPTGVRCCLCGNGGPIGKEPPHAEGCLAAPF